MFQTRQATLADLDFLVDVDRRGEGLSNAADYTTWTAQEIADHRAKIEAFVTRPTEVAWIIEDQPAGRKCGTIMVRFRDRFHEAPTDANLFLFNFIDVSFFPPDGRFCEVFDLWVDPVYRRRGLATHLKRVAETESLRRGITMIYTHTEERNTHVTELNRKLGYREIRRGTIWDDVIRISLVKDLHVTP